MNKKEVIERLCTLASKVASVKYDNTISADCFCTERSYDPDGIHFQFHPEVLAFIENAVTEKLQKDHLSR